MSVYFVGKSRFFSGLTNCRPTIRAQWNASSNASSGPPSAALHQKAFKSNQASSATESTNAVKSLNNNSTCAPLYQHQSSGHSNGSSGSSSKAAGGWFTLRGVILKWTPIGICIVAAVQWQMHQHRRSPLNGGDGQLLAARTASQWQTSLYCSLPLRLLSRGWGWLADCRVPIPVRPFVYGCYSAAFGVNLQEAASSDFKDYRSLAEFFTRSLKENARLIDATSCLVSPADGRVLHFGRASNDQVEQVKGVTYSLQSFLGPANWSTDVQPSYADSVRLNRDTDTELYQCIIYLAPGDYHRFHSPTAWQPELRRHFVGELLSVSPQVAHWLPGLFCLNERATYMGRWKHGFFSFTAVGATNVGSVEIYMDEALRTNRWQGVRFGRQNADGDYEECRMPVDAQLAKGELLGQFNMGSTVVLVFEAPRRFRFNVQPGQKIRMGEPLGCVPGHEESPTPA